MVPRQPSVVGDRASLSGSDGNRHRKGRGVTCRTCQEHRAICVGIVFALACDMAVSSMLSQERRVYLLLCCVRVIVLSSGFVLAVKFGTGAWTCERCTFRTSAHVRCGLRHGAAPDVHLVAPLANNDRLQNGCSGISASSLVSTAFPEGAAELGQAVALRSSQLDEELAQLREFQEVKEGNSGKRNLVLGLCFITMTVQSTFTGAQVLTVSAVSPLMVCLLTATIVCMNTEFLLLKRLVDFMTEDNGVLVQGLHEHKLYYQRVAQFAWCKVCRERIGPRTGGHEGFKCKDCDGDPTGGGPHGGGANFWVCLPCYRKQQSRTNTEEGILRGDRGPKFAEELSTWHYFRRALQLTKPFRSILWVAVVCVIITQGARVLMPRYQGSIITALIDERPESFTRALVTFVLLSAGSLVFGSLQSLTVEIVQRRITCDIRTVMFQSLIRQDIAFFDGVMTGQLTSRMTNDVAAVVQPVRQLLNTVLSNILLLMGGLCMCLATSWRLTVLAATMIGPVIYLTAIYARWSKKINLKIRVNMADANAVATEALRNIRTVRSFGADDIEMRHFQKHMDEALRSGMKDAYGSAGVSAATQYVDLAATVLILWYGGVTVMRRGEGLAKLNIGQLITFNLYWNMMKNAIQGLNGMLNTLVRAASAAQRVFEIMDLRPDISLDAGGLALDKEQLCEVQFQDVCFTYQMRPDKQVLSGLSFTIPPGNTVAVVGRSGAGKSTLVSLLLRFYDPQGGLLLLNGHPLAEHNLRAYQKRVGVVSQETQVFCRTVRENITYGLPGEGISADMVVEAARMANAHEFISDLDEGYNAMIGEGGVRLSGGQRQRMAIARALLRRPSLLLLDEATSALDAENEGKVQQSLDTLVQSMEGRCSVMLIAHRLSTVMGAHKIVVLEGGRVAEQGNHDDLLEAEGIYAQLVKRQLAKQANLLSDMPADVAQSSVTTETLERQSGRRGRGKGGGTGKSRAGTEAANVAHDSIDGLFGEVGCSR